MAKYLRQSTASQEIPLGYFVDSTDGNTEETALTIANTDIKLWKTGATTLANKNSGGATHISNGIYYAVLDATDTDTLGPFKVFVHVTGALAFEDSYEIITQAAYDELHSLTETSKIERAAFLVDTTIATLASQTSFTLTDGSVDDNAYNGQAFIFTDATTAVQKGIAFASDYTGATKTVTLEAAPGFTIATSDLVTVVPAGSSASSVATIQSGLATQASVDTIDNFLDTEMAAVLAAVDTEVAAIKAKTDSLTFTTANMVDAAVKRVGATTLNAAGTGGQGYGA